MSSVFQHYNPYTTQSNMNWQGLKSSKFGRTRLYIAPKDIISPGMSYPNQKLHGNSQRKHLYQMPSLQKQFKPNLKQFNDIKHWTPRISCKKIVDYKPTQPNRRPQRLHLNAQSPRTDRYAGIRTFYNTRLKDDKIQYSIQDRMQRKVRNDILQTRRSFYDKSALF